MVFMFRYFLLQKYSNSKTDQRLGRLIVHYVRVLKVSICPLLTSIVTAHKGPF